MTESLILLIKLNVEEIDRRESGEMVCRREEDRFRAGGWWGVPEGLQSTGLQRV